MDTLHDPTNAHAVPGPSRIRDGQSEPVSAGATSSFASAMPAATGTGASNAPATATATAAHGPGRRAVPSRRADGPLLVPTVVATDGIREVPGAFEHCEMDDLITLVASMLDKLRDHNDRIPLTPNSLTRFHSRAPPNISVRDYLLRIAKFTNVEACCLLILLPYVDKVCARLPTFTVSSLTVHRFIIAAISVGSKALSDAFCTNGRYARVGGVSVVEMNLLEKEFCEALDWRLTTSGPVLAHYYTSLVNAHPQYRLSSAPLPTPPPPPEIEIPPPASPLDPLSPRALSNPPASLFSVMDVDQDPALAPRGPAPSSSSGPSSGGPAGIPAPVERCSPSTPSPASSPARSIRSSLASSEVSPSSGSALSLSHPHSLTGSPDARRARPRRPIASPTKVDAALAAATPAAPAAAVPRSGREPGPTTTTTSGTALGLTTGRPDRGGLNAPGGAGLVAPLSPAKRARNDSPAGTGDGPRAVAGTGLPPDPRFLPSPRRNGAGLESTAATAVGAATAVREGGPPL